MTEIDIRNVGIVGVGVVGDAVRSYLEGQGLQPKLYDKFSAVGSLEEVNQADVVFVCVPTPYVDGVGFQADAVIDVLGVLEGSKAVMVKSTLQPGTTEALQASFPQHAIFFQPEFLREKTAREDFLVPDRQLMGYTAGHEALAEQLLTLLPPAPYTKTLPATEAELVKIATNAFLALKVTFSNQIFDLCTALGINYNEVKSGIGADPRIGGSHMEIYDSGYRGYGGKCLPKDTRGLIDVADAHNSPVTLFKTVHEINEALIAGNPERVLKTAVS